MTQKKTLQPKSTIKIKVNLHNKQQNKVNKQNKTKINEQSKAKTSSHAHVQKNFKNKNEKQLSQSYLLIMVTSILFAHRS
jgi:hypothetical protein